MVKKSLIKFNKIILCSGTVVGRGENIKNYLKSITANIFKFKYRKLKYLLTFRPDPEGRGCDQGHANFLVHNQIDNYKLYSNSHGPVATVLYLKKLIWMKSRI